MDKDKIWTITLTESQMRLLANALEDWHRFISGQCSMDSATSLLWGTPQAAKVKHILNHEVKPIMFPELSEGESYSWNGGHPDPEMSRAAAMSYMMYREILYQLALAYGSGNVYASPTLRCLEQGPLIIVKEAKTAKRKK